MAPNSDERADEEKRQHEVDGLRERRRAAGIDPDG
jgi:hypothetical protein